MQHRPRLTPFGRELLVQRVEQLGWTPSVAAEALGVSRATAYKWLRRFRELGSAGLQDGSSRPQRCPRALRPAVVARILRARRRLRQGPHRLSHQLGLPRSTIYAVLRRHHLNRLRDADRVTAVPVRYVRERPGELLHLDIKKLGTVPPGGGHRLLGWQAGKVNRRKGGYEYIHVAVDDASRFAFVQVHPDDREGTTAQFLLDAASRFAEHGVRIERILTDRGGVYRSRWFATILAQLSIQHRWTRPYRPQTNGKAERFIKTLVDEWAYARFYRSNQVRRLALPQWLDFYNQRRPHTALNGLTPKAALVNNVCGNHT